VSILIAIPTIPSHVLFISMKIFSILPEITLTERHCPGQ
jgi:hypothetical protein